MQLLISDGAVAASAMTRGCTVSEEVAGIVVAIKLVAPVHTIKGVKSAAPQYNFILNFAFACLPNPPKNKK